MRKNKHKIWTNCPIKNKELYLKLVALTILLSFFLLSTFTFAVPNTMNIRGKLLSPSGSILTGTFNFTFRIYDNYTSGNKLYETNITSATDVRGIYDVILKDINLTFQDQLYLAIKINNDNEMEPRINLTAVPYTFRANISEGLNRNNVYTVAGLNATENISVGNRLTFGLGEFIDNIASGWLRLTGTLNVTNSLSVAGSLNVSEDIGVNKQLNITAATGSISTAGSITASGAMTALGTVRGNILTDGAATITNGVVNASQVQVGGGFSAGGLTLQSNGNIVTQGDVLFSGNVTILNVSYLSVNGSIIPGLDNTFDVGNASLRWRNANFSGTLFAVTVDGTNVRVQGRDVQIEENAFKLINFTSNLNSVNASISLWNVSGSNIFLREISGNVGIGTTSPLARLHVVDPNNDAQVIIGGGTRGILGQINFDSGFYNLFQTSGTRIEFVNRSIVVWTSGGSTATHKIGIDTGVTEPGSKLSVNGSGSFGTGYAFTAAPANGLIVQGNVGIGTTSPNDALEVIGNVRISGSLNATSINATNLYAASYNIGWTNLSSYPSACASGQFVSSVGDSLTCGLPSAGGAWNSSGTNVYLNDTTASVGIGTTSPATLLQLAATSPELRLNSTQGGYIGLKTNINNNTDFAIQQNGTNILFINPAGNLGIGTTSPSERLELSAVSGTNVKLKIDALGGASSHLLLNSGHATDPEWGIASRGDDSTFAIFNDNGITAGTVLTIQQSGNVGIGTTTPNQALTVVGNANITGKVNITGDLDVRGSSITLGDATTDTLNVNAFIGTNLIPIDNARDLGSASNFWRRAYVDILTVTNLSATASNISGTTSPSFIINTNYTGNDDRNVELIFERGTPTTNAVLAWDSTNKRFDINFPLFIQANNNLTVDTNTLFVDGSVDRVGIGTTTPGAKLHILGGNISLDSTYRINTLVSNIPRASIQFGHTSDNEVLILRQSSFTPRGVYIAASGESLPTTYAAESRFGVDMKTIIAGTLNVTASGGGGDLFVASSGNVGIGTANPAYLLTVADTTGSGLSMNVSDILFVNGSSNRVGIGTAGPVTKLDFGASVANVAQIINLYTSGNTRAGIGMDSATAGLRYYVPTGSPIAIFGIVSDSDGSTFSEKVRIDTSGNVGIGTTGPQNKLEVIGAATFAGGVNASSLNVTGFSITDDSLITLSDGSKKKIKDIKAGQYVLSLNEVTGKLQPAKVNALLDHGIKPIYEMTTVDGRAINTTAEHPYYTKSGSLPNKISKASEGVITLSGKDSFNPLSPERILQLNLRDRATYGTSFKCGAMDTASLALSSNALNGIISTDLLMKSSTSKISPSESFDIEVILSRLLASSEYIYCVEISSNFSNMPFSSKTKRDLPLVINDENTTLKSTTSIIFYDTFLFSEYSIPAESKNLLDIDKLTSSASSFACFSVNLDLDTIDSILFISDNFSLNSSFKNLENNNCHIFSGISLPSTVSNSLLTSSGTLNSTSAILISPNDSDENDYLKLSNDAPLGEWIEVRYLKAGDEIAVPDYESNTTKFEKIASITILEPQHVYDLSIEGTRNFIANDIVAHNTYLATSSGNVGIGTTSPGTALHVIGSINASTAYRAADGSASAPSYTFDSDTDTGLRRKSADNLTIVTNGVDRLSVDGNGNITALPSARFVGNGTVPTGMIAFFANACPSGWTEYTTANGRFIVAITGASTNAGTLGTAFGDLADASYTPSGSLDSVSAGTPSGTNAWPVGVPIWTTGAPTGLLTASATPTFTGNALAGHAHTFTGNALAGHAHTFTGNALANHNHEVPMMVDGAGQIWMNAKYGTVNIGATQASATTTLVAGDTNIHALSSSNSGGTPSGTISSVSGGTPSGSISSDSAGTPSGTVSAHQHGADAITAGMTGTNAWPAGVPAFSGSALAGHAHTFTGSANTAMRSTVAPYIQLRACQAP